ncbi:hypothetical protein Tsubulata_034161 [Turnera subulata]|uniref:NAC domain-containing protein n=1 Tax=Turnera subulata TaxID=218843 RepID=A0A9Q0FU65_9ROSI|nr:hypothetical protein Tsubulata_034161 [Turnera subulata]
MCPPTTSPLADIDFDCTFEKLFLSLEKLNQGCPPPRNVITYVNPYNHYPSTLPDGIWYFVHSKENNGMELGFWKAKDEACKIFSNSILTGWRTTLEFFKGKVPHEQKTDWMMEEYWITHKALGGNSKAKVDSSLCRVFLSAQQGLDHKLQQKMTSSKIVEEPCPFLTESIVPKAHSGMSNGSTSKPEVGIDEAAREMAVTGGPSNHLVENLPEVDYFSGGDYLELLDLVNPASPSSSSDNSSCLTMSSDEYFDSLALLRDIESLLFV